MILLADDLLLLLQSYGYGNTQRSPTPVDQDVDDWPYYHTIWQGPGTEIACRRPRTFQTMCEELRVGILVQLRKFY
ncbi:hypothetical protein NLJ89_g2635 [Agrocybe chaxingu]|uniref:Uncharacterized protein n=1 Tax=Agrocybe chaxingu TaxID=84603 RepID=A0A9W8K6F6_9AGAR|nr:hypothetical protein NLJ89_g2635 [Agrocybe chaxingu]